MDVGCLLDKPTAVPGRPPSAFRRRSQWRRLRSGETTKSGGKLLKFKDDRLFVHNRRVKRVFVYGRRVITPGKRGICARKTSNYARKKEYLCTEDGVITPGKKGYLCTEDKQLRLEKLVFVYGRRVVTH